jgi:hypothetical protein
MGSVRTEEAQRRRNDGDLLGDEHDGDVLGDGCC